MYYDQCWPFINNKIFSSLFYIFRFISLHTKLEFDFLQLQIFFWQKIFYVIQTYKKISAPTQNTQKKVAIRIFKKIQSYTKSQVNTLQMHTTLTQTNLPWKLGHFFIYHPKLPNEVPSGNLKILLCITLMLSHIWILFWFLK